MHIAINGKFTSVRQTGVQRYSAEISSRLVARWPERYTVLAPSWSSTGAQASGDRRTLIRLANNLWEQTLLPARSASAYELLYSPGNSMPLLATNAVVVLHDVIPIVHPEWFSASYAAWAKWMIPRAARRARWVITVSETVRDILTEMFPGVKGRISVAPNGVGEQFVPANPLRIADAKRRYGIAGKYVLSVGTLDPRKNLTRVLEAWAAAAPQLPDHELVVVGMKSDLFPAGHAAAGTLHQLPRVKWLGFVPDADLPTLYSGATLLIYPSLDEGFGIPPLESMACGRPVVVSRAGALGEVCGDAAEYVDPFRPDSIANGILRVATDSALAAMLVQRGAKRAAHYTWDAAADTTDRVLREVASRGASA